MADPLTEDELDFLRIYGAKQYDARAVRRLVPRLLATLDAVRAAQPVAGEGLAEEVLAVIHANVYDLSDRRNTMEMVRRTFAALQPASEGEG